MVKSDSYGSIKTRLSEIVDNVMNCISIAAEGPSLSSTAASSCHGGNGASTDVSLIGSPIQSEAEREDEKMHGNEILPKQDVMLVKTMSLKKENMSGKEK
ncbi:hypothetical protein PoB_002077800 [Plakobranchus ocellatus]|uniref:Uncharacterized protein n=1 Tax=Plakobranchus ocellatus TaxID=259542 RepID=A0AAV3ZIC8_9GAST|nr:hypothetical protein PoB_002077800 [Plakobranchus ocellatus]